jgi:hypothetical protein
VPLCAGPPSIRRTGAPSVSGPLGRAPYPVDELQAGPGEWAPGQAVRPLRTQQSASPDCRSSGPRSTLPVTQAACHVTHERICHSEYPLTPRAYSVTVPPLSLDRNPVATVRAVCRHSVDSIMKSSDNRSTTHHYRVRVRHRSQASLNHARSTNHHCTVGATHETQTTLSSGTPCTHCYM